MLNGLFAEIKAEGLWEARCVSSVLQIAVFTQGARVCLGAPLCVQQHSLSKEVARPLNPTYTQRRKTQTAAQQTRRLFD